METTSYSRRSLALLCVLTLGALGLTACSSDESSNDSAAASTATENSATTLLIGADLTYPPYDYFDDDDNPAGFDADLWALLGPTMGVDYEFVDTRFEQLIPGLNSGQFDLISSALYITAERAEQVDYIPYFSTGNSIISQVDGSLKPSTIEDLCGLSVATLKGSDISDRLSNEADEVCAAAGLDEIEVNDFPTDPEASQALIAGQVDAQVTDAAVAANLVKEQDELEITSTELLYPVPVGIAVKAGNDSLREQIEAGLDELRESGKLEELLDSYNLTEPTQEELDAALAG